MRSTTSWSEKNIVTEHGYDKVVQLPQMDRIASYIKAIPEEEINLLDVGAGNGRFALSLKKTNKEYNYLGLDCNAELIKIGNNYFNTFGNVNLELCDINLLESFEKYTNRIFLFESTLTMLRDPLKTLELATKVSNIIFLSRIHFKATGKNSCKKNSWLGMSEPSYNWSLSLDSVQGINSEWQVLEIEPRWTKEAWNLYCFVKKGYLPQKWEISL